MKALRYFFCVVLPPLAVLMTGRIANSLETRRLHLLLDNQRAAFEEAVRARSLELREARSNSLHTAE